MPVKAVVDTNIWISSLLTSSKSKTAANLVDEWKNGKFSIVISEQQIVELHDVFSRPKFLFKYKISRDEINDLISSIALRAERVTLKGSLELCRDPDDNIIIETATIGKAKYLVTGDKDITDDKEILLFLLQHGVSVISVAKFLKLLK